ncbi:MAG TPA: lysophospholipid acyltransferase family protein [Verrucomicrobiae bacterium]|nr:lysophospholipid acyltransferase family protein [Verrucomicrobiae bacterium]
MHPWYRFCRFLYRVYFRVYHRGRIYNARRLPDEGAVLLAGNHVSFLDPPFFGLACKREAFFMARDTLFRNPLAGAILRSWNCVPISRDRGDLGAMRAVLRLLGEGKAVLMFPEGTRSPDGRLQEPRAGVGMIVARAKVPIVPLRIFGTDRALPRGSRLPRPARIEIKFGEPFTYPLPADFDQRHGDDQKAVYLDIGREIMRRIAALEPRPE